MGRNRFVVPNVDRLPISDGDWVDVKRELATGDQRKVFSGSVKEYRSGERAKLDPDLVGISKLLQFIVAWSLEDAKGPVPWILGDDAKNLSAIRNLDTGTFSEIFAAIEAHEETQDAARAERKNGKDGAKASSPISPSVNG